MTLSVPGVNPLVAPATGSASFNAAAYDGTIDFGGPSGHDSGLKTQPDREVDHESPTPTSCRNSRGPAR